MQTFYIRNRGRVIGPFNADQLRLMIIRGHLTRVHELSQDQVIWQPVSSFPDLIPAVQPIISTIEMASPINLVQSPYNTQPQQPIINPIESIVVQGVSSALQRVVQYKSEEIVMDLVNDANEQIDSDPEDYTFDYD
jgi:hypothetical protein